MGITKKDCQLLFYAKKSGVSFEKTVSLGRLILYATKSEIKMLTKEYKIGMQNELPKFPDEYSEPIFKILGASEIDSLDISDYEGATIIHDLNHPITNNLISRFTCVVDSGTIEHVFNFPVAIKNCMNVLKVGGHYIGITPVNNQMGHGFYQFSPELYYRIFAEENGFKVNNMFITPGNNEDAWYEVIDPAKVGSRITLVNSYPVTLMVIAEKINECDVFQRIPYQSDYSKLWQSTNPSYLSEEKAGLLRKVYRKTVPKRLRNILYRFYHRFKTEKTETEYLGNINSQHFKKVNL